MKHVIVRAAMWASAGVLVSVAWGGYFATADRDLRIEPIVYALAAWTQPMTAAALHLDPSRSVSLAWATVTNAATYALVGLIVETIRRLHRTPRIPN